MLPRPRGAPPSSVTAAATTANVRYLVGWLRWAWLLLGLVAVGALAMSIVNLAIRPGSTVVGPLNCTEVNTCVPPPPPPMTCTDVNGCVNGSSVELASLTCTSNSTIDPSCLPHRIASINLIPPRNNNSDFNIIAGPGLAVQGVTHGVIIYNNINVTITGSIFTVSIMFGNVTIVPHNQTANTVLAGPTSGPAAQPIFRALVEPDIPLLNVSKLYGVLPLANGGTGQSATTYGANTFWAGPVSGAPAAPAFRTMVASDLTPLGLTDGQLLIGSTGGAPVAANLVAGANIVVTNTPGGIMISASINASAIGTVYSVGLSLPGSLFAVSNSPVTTTGTLTGTLVSQAANTFFGGPNGASGVPTFRTLVLPDMPALGVNQIYTNQGAGNVVSTLVAGPAITIVNSGGVTNISTTALTSSVGLNMTGPLYTISNSPVTTTGTLTATLNVQLKNALLIGPVSGPAAEPTFRTLQVPDLTPLGMTNGQLLIGFTAGPPALAVPTGSGGISIGTGPGTLNVAMTATPIFTSLDVTGVTTLGTITSCGAPLQPSCIDISSQTCPGGALSTNCIPTSGLHLQDLTVNNLVIVNSSTIINTDILNGTSVTVQDLFVTNGHVSGTLVCTGNGTISPECVDISNKLCPLGPLKESCIPDTLHASNMTVTGILSVNQVVCVSNPLEAACIPTRIATINGIPPTTGLDFELIAGTGITIVDGTSNVTIVNTLETTSHVGNLVYATPNGSPGIPSFRTLVLPDMPALGINEIYTNQGAGNVLSTLVAGPAIIITNTGGVTNISTTALTSSVGLVITGPLYTVSNSPVTTSGTLTATLNVQAANAFFAGPTGGGPAAPTFRSIVLADLPPLLSGQLYIGTSTGIPVVTSLTAGLGILMTPGSGSLTVTASIASVGLSLPGSLFSVSNSPLMSSGTITATLVSQAANTVFAAPNGTSGTPSFRLLTMADIASGTLSVARGGTGTSSLTGNQVIISNNAGTAMVEAGVMTNGAILVGSTGNSPVVTTITPGSGIVITNGPGSITIAANTSGVGTVTSVDMTVPTSIMSVTGGPVTMSGTLAVTLVSQTANTFFAGPDLVNGIPTFRSILYNDLPRMTNGQLYIGTTGGPIVASTLTGNPGIAIVSGAGNIAINNTMSVALSVPGGLLSVTGSPLTGTGGTLAVGLVSQAANTVFAGPNATSGAPTFRSLVSDDIPSLDTAKLTTGTLPIARGGTNSGVPLNNNRLIVSSGGALVEAAAATNGQIPIGSTGAAPVLATITAGTGISVTNGPGSISIASTATGTVTSVNMTVPSALLSVTGGPITTSGTLAVTLVSQTANTFFAAPDGANGTPSFRSMLYSDLPRMTNGQLYIGSTGSSVVAATLQGTTNQVNVASGAGSIILSTPQNIHTAATPTFASLTLSSVTNQLTLGTTNTATISATAPAASRTYTVADPGANANFVMDTAGALTITNAAAVGSVLTGTSTTTASWQPASVATSLSNNEVSSTTTISAFGSASFTLVTGMTMTLTAGTWHVHFSTSATPSTSSGLFQFQVFNGASAVGHSIRTMTGSSGTFVIHTMAKVVSDGINAITVQWQKVSGSGTADMLSRSMFALRVA